MVLNHAFSLIFLTFDAGCEQNASFRVIQFIKPGLFGARSLCSLNMEKGMPPSVGSHLRLMRHAPS